MRKITFLLLTILPMMGFAQTYDFNGTDGGWTGVQSTLTQNATSVTLSFDADTDPKLRHAAANVTDPVTNGIIGITLKNNSTASEFRYVFENLQAGGTSGVVISISPNDTAFQTYYIDLSDDDRWDNAGAGGTQNALDFAFREPGGSSTDNSVDNAGSIEIDQVVFLNSIPAVERNIFTFDSSVEGWDDTIRCSVDAVGGNLEVQLAGTGTPGDTNNSKVALNSLYYVNATNNGVLHLTLKNNTNDDQIKVVYPDGMGGTVTVTQIISTNDANFVTYDFDLASNNAAWTGNISGVELVFDDSAGQEGTGLFQIDSIIFDNTLSVQTNQPEAKVSVYPNPANGFVNISSTQAVSKVEIFDVTGKKVMNVSNLVNDQVNVSSLRTGLYLIRIFGDDQNSVTKKLVIQN